MSETRFIGGTTREFRPDISLGSSLGSIRNNSDSRVVSTTLIPFIRSRKVFFYARGLLPNTTHLAYFDGIDVSDFCREETFTQIADLTTQNSTTENANISSHPEGSTALVSDSNGEIQGSFFIPNTPALRFRAGTREFKLLDADATTDANAISKAFANYTAQGTLETRQITNFVTLRPTPPVIPRIRLIDPVAQSFVIDNSVGAFITSIDIPFQSASTTVPIRCQIRPMQLGLPTNAPLPNAEAWLNASAFTGKTSNTPSFSNSNTYVTFTFPEPVYVEGGVEYAIVLLAETTDYTVWTAKIADFIAGSTTQRVLKQPTLGSFFKSQNGSTWTPDQSRDMMFRLKRANFTLSTATAYFENVASLPVQLLSENPLTTVSGTKVVRVYHPNHGMFTGSQVTISGASATNGIPANEINTTHTITAVDHLDSYTITVSTTNATSSGTGGGSAVKATENYTYNILQPNVNVFTLPNTDVQFAVKTTTAQSVAGSETPYTKDSSYESIFINDNNEFTSPRTVPSQVNATASLSGERGLALRTVMSTTNSYVSPVLDLSRLSVNLIGNRIDRPAASPATGFNVPYVYVAETETLQSNDPSIQAVAKHLTNSINLQEPALGLRVLFAANRPSDSYIELYYKVLPVGSDDKMEDLNWTLATIDEEIQTDDDPNIFREYKYTIDEDQFATFALKFVFTSSNSSNVPRLKDLRVIALAT